MQTSERFRTLFCTALLGLVPSSPQAQSATMTVPGMGQVVAGNGAKQTLKCGGEAVTVTGNGNRVTLTGTCTRIMVNGNRNVVVAATAGQIVVNGKANTVSWQKATRGARPVQRVTGSGNSVLKR